MSIVGRTPLESKDTQLLICVWKDKPLLDIIQPDMQKAYELAQMYFLPRKN